MLALHEFSICSQHLFKLCQMAAQWTPKHLRISRMRHLQVTPSGFSCLVCFRKKQKIIPARDPNSVGGQKDTRLVAVMMMMMMMTTMMMMMATHRWAHRSRHMRAHESRHIRAHTWEHTHESRHMQAHIWKHTYESTHMKAYTYESTHMKAHIWEHT